jgi:Domain of unknown function (DUF4190)
MGRRYSQQLPRDVWQLSWDHRRGRTNPFEPARQGVLVTNPGEYQGYQQPQQGGYPPAPPGYGYPPQQQSNGLAVAGLVCGIVGVLIANIILGPLAIIFGSVALSRANRGAPRKNMAIAALVLGIVDIAVWVIVLIAVSNSNGFTY